MNKKIIRKFAYFPVKINDNRWIWLKKYSCIYEYIGYTDLIVGRGLLANFIDWKLIEKIG